MQNRLKNTSLLIGILLTSLTLVSCSSQKKKTEQHLFGASVGRWHAEPLRYDIEEGELYAIGMSEGELMSSDPEDVARNRAYEKAEKLWRSSLTGVRALLKSRGANPKLTKHRLDEILSVQRLFKTGDEIFEGKDAYNRTWVVYRFELKDRWFVVQDELMENLAGINREELDGVKITGDQPLMTFLVDLRSEMADSEASWGRLPNHKGLGFETESD
jgi:hypothetical protein